MTHYLLHLIQSWLIGDIAENNHLTAGHKKQAVMALILNTFLSRVLATKSLWSEKDKKTGKGLEYTNSLINTMAATIPLGSYLNRKTISLRQQQSSVPVILMPRENRTLETLQKLGI